MQPRRCPAALGLCLALLLPVQALAETARGVVFEDLNGNRSRDAGEPGIPGVRISDGSQIRVTDEDGAYELDIDAPAVRFITKPAAGCQ